MDFGNVGSGASSMALPLLKRLFPYTSTINYPYKSDPERAKRFEKASKVTIALVFIYMFGLPFLYTSLIIKIAPPIRQAFITENGTYYSPDSLMYAITAIAFTLATLTFWMTITQKLYLQNDFKEYEDYYNSTWEYDNTKAAKVFAIIGLALTLITIPFTFGARVVVNDNEITLKKFYNLTAHKYSFDELDMVSYYNGSANRDGRITHFDRYDLHFSDGYSFNLYFYTGNSDSAKKIATDISRVSNKEIQHLGIYEK